MRGVRPRVYTVQTLLRQLDEGRFAVPKLQREFVWTGARAAKLFDSIYREMPIGTLVVWRTSSKYEPLLRRSLGVLPDFRSIHPEIRFLIDGQQRLSVIHRGAAGGSVRNSDGTEVDFSRVVFHLDSSEDESEPNFSYRAPVGSFESLQRILSGGWRRHFQGLGRKRLKRIEQCRDRILHYRLPIIEVETEEIAEVRELFVRINTQGMRISSADAAFARATSFDLRQRAQQVRDQLPEGFRRVRYETILQALAFTQGIRDVGERSYSGLIDEWNNKIAGGGRVDEVLPDWKRLTRAFDLAIEYLQNYFAVADESVLPSDNMLTTLSIYFFHRPKQPPPAVRRELAKWFWATAVGQRYSGRGFRQNMVKDCKFFERAAVKPTRFVVSGRIDRHDVRRAEYNRRTSLSDGFFCLLALQRPRFLGVDGEAPQRGLASRAHKEHRHHIFPKARLARAGFAPREYNSICNMALLPATENIEIGARAPRTYLEPFRDLRHFQRSMRSHLIPVEPTSAIWSEDIESGYRQFRDARAQLICDAFEKVAGIRLFTRA
jgi:hypothetical protein